MSEIILSGHQPGAAPVVLTDDDTTVTVTAGSVFGTVTGDFSIWARDVSNTTVNVHGTAAGGDWATIDAFDEVGAEINVGSAGRVLGGNFGAMAIEVSFDARIANAGEIRSSRGFGIVFVSPTSDSLVVNDGSIFGVPAGVEFTGGWDGGASARLINHGSIEAGDGLTGVGGQASGEAVYSNAGYTEILNTGLITSSKPSGSAISIEPGEWGILGTATITNSGTISSTWRWGLDLARLNGASTVDNSGSIVGTLGGLLGSAGTDNISNSGEFSGNVMLRGGNDVFTGTTGRVFGAIDGGAGNDRVVGGLTSDAISGGGGADTLLGGANNDTLGGSDGNDSLNGGIGNDSIGGGDGNDSLLGGYGNDTIFSGAGNDSGAGGAGNDSMVGGDGTDTLGGESGNDTLGGGTGKDVLVGGSGGDVFDFNLVTESPFGAACDELRAGGGSAKAFDAPGGTGPGDRIDLSGIDANANVGGDQAFAFGTATATGIGRLWCVNSGTITRVYANVDGDTAIEFRLDIFDGGTLATAYNNLDFIL